MLLQLNVPFCVSILIYVLENDKDLPLCGRKLGINNA